jgi:hypothetical protein
MLHGQANMIYKLIIIQYSDQAVRIISSSIYSHYVKFVNYEMLLCGGDIHTWQATLNDN